MTVKHKLTISDKLYWFSNNLKRFPFVVIWLPFEFLLSFLHILKILFTTDGSEVLNYPWEHRKCLK